MFLIKIYIRIFLNVFLIRAKTAYFCVPFATKPDPAKHDWDTPVHKRYKIRVE